LVSRSRQGGGSPVLTGSLGRSLRFLSLSILIYLCAAAVAQGAPANQLNHLNRLEIKGHAGYTRLLFKLDASPDYAVANLPDQRLRLILHDTDSRLFKRLRTYTDSQIRNVVLARRGSDLLVTLVVKEQKSRVRCLAGVVAGTLVLDIGPRWNKQELAQIPLGRERIWSGAEQFVMEFDPPLKMELPFVPTEPHLLQTLLSPAQLQLFARGEALLYKGKASEAAAIFSQFQQQELPIQAVAVYRLGEAFYLQQNYPRALRAFVEGERLWPDYLGSNPAATFYYADCIVRCGNYAAGRKRLARLIGEQSDRKYAPLLASRLADIALRARHETEAVAIYRNVMSNFPNSKAAFHAGAKLADRQLFSVGSFQYRTLLDVYGRVFEQCPDFVEREAALFKIALLEGLYGRSVDALAAANRYENLYPQGVFITIINAMREDLLLIRSRELAAAGDDAGLVRLAQDYHSNLARCCADAGFVERLAGCFTALGKVEEERVLFSNLAEREWAAGSAPFMLARVIEADLQLADYSDAEAAARSFLQRFASHPLAGRVKERLAGVCFQQKRHTEVAALLEWLLEPGGRAEFPESYYYLGKSLAGTGSLRGAEQAMALFIRAEAKGNYAPPLVCDAYLVAATARQVRGDRQGAMALYRAGHAVAHGEWRDQFRYRIGELLAMQGESGAAREEWQRLVKEGSDPLWLKLGSQALTDLAWRDKNGAIRQTESK
jgi:TolA-binding protein